MPGPDMVEPIKSDRWSVVTIAHENPEVIKRFVAWHKHMGAAEITVFFDDPRDPCIELIAHMDGVNAVGCDDRFWASLKMTADTRFTKRQNAACRLGYDAAAAGWVLNIDADELLFIHDVSVAEFLAAQPKDCRSVLVRPAERVLIDGDETRPAFRAPMPREVVEEVYADLAGLVIRNDGLVGHNIGKSILRTGLGKFWMRQHYGQLSDGTQIVDATVGPEQGAMLLHFFNRGYDDWRRKLDYRLANRGFRHRMRAMLAEARDDGDEPRLKSIFEQLHHITADQATLMTSNGALHRPELGLDSLIAQYF